MELEPATYITGLHYRKEMLEGVKFVNNLVIEEPKHGLFFINAFEDEALQRVNDVHKTVKTPSQTSRGILVGLKMDFKPHKEYRHVPKKATANSSGNKKKGTEPTIEVRNSNPFDVLNSVDNDGEFGTNRGTTNLVNNGATSRGSSFMNVDNSSSITTLIIEKIGKFEDLLTSGQAILVDKAGNPLKKVEFLGEYDSEDEVASVDNDMTRSMTYERLRADMELKENIIMAMPKITREGHYTCNVHVEYEWKPPRCSSYKVFGHIHEEYPKNTCVGKKKTVKTPSQTSRGILVGLKMDFKPHKEYRHVPKKATANSSAYEDLPGALPAVVVTGVDNDATPTRVSSFIVSFESVDIPIPEEFFVYNMDTCGLNDGKPYKSDVVLKDPVGDFYDVRDL
nr:hypothetical protein [Tanacetum cinerariifolium]